MPTISQPDTSAPAAVVTSPSPSPSPRLLAFTADYPWERGTILEFMLRVAHELPVGARVLDVGAGEAPYAELFGHVEYLTSDWEHSVHPGARRADVVGSADDLPVDDAAFDAVINTQVLEHVRRPERVVAELYRVLKPGGRLYLTVPMVWELHEEPYDFYRYTPHSLRYLLEQAGFAELDIRARNDCFTTIAQLMRNAAYVMGRRADGLDPMREWVGQTMRSMADMVAAFSPLDTQWIFPLGYMVTALKPARVANARSVAVAAFADELAETPQLLADYADRFTDADDVTLAVLASGEQLPAAVGVIKRLGLEGETNADILLVPPVGVSGASVDALLSARPTPAAFSRVPRFDSTSLGELQCLVVARLTQED